MGFLITLLENEPDLIKSTPIITPKKHIFVIEVDFHPNQYITNISILKNRIEERYTETKQNKEGKRTWR